MIIPLKETAGGKEARPAHHLVPIHTQAPSGRLRFMAINKAWGRDHVIRAQLQLVPALNNSPAPGPTRQTHCRVQEEERPSRPTDPSEAGGF